ncbi:MAG: NAD(P)-binding protein [Pseudomonadota bacterium]
MSIAIIGAGCAGLAAGQTLLAAGHAVELFEKSKGLGGRCASRRREGLTFNHGAPMAHGLPGDIAQHLTPHEDGHIAEPGMSALGHLLAEGLTVHRDTEITAITPNMQHEFDAVLLAIPVAQATRLLGPRAAAFPALTTATMAPQITTMLAFDAPIGAPNPHPDIDKAIPQNADHTTWVVHGSAALTATHLEDDKDTIAAALTAAFREATSAPEPTLSMGHKWRYARTATPLGQSHLWSAEHRIGLAGDWCLGPNVGHAIASGRALAKDVAKALASA